MTTVERLGKSQNFVKIPSFPRYSTLFKKWRSEELRMTTAIKMGKRSGKSLVWQGILHFHAQRSVELYQSVETRDFIASTGRLRQGDMGQENKGTRGQEDKRTRGQGDKGTRGQGDKGTREQGDKRTREQGNKGTRGQREKGTREKGHKGTRGQRNKGTRE